MDKKNINYDKLICWHVSVLNVLLSFFFLNKNQEKKHIQHIYKKKNTKKKKKDK